MDSKNKKLKIIEFISNIEVYRRMYIGVRDFDKAMKIEDKLISQMERIVKVYNEKLSVYRDKKNKAVKEGASLEKLSEINKEFNDMREKEIELELFYITKEQAREAGFNPLELNLIKEFIKN